MTDKSAAETEQCARGRLHPGPTADRQRGTGTERPGQPVLCCVNNQTGRPARASDVSLDLGTPLWSGVTLFAVIQSRSYAAWVCCVLSNVGVFEFVGIAPRSLWLSIVASATSGVHHPTGQH